jgi:hypothetical protein
MQVASAYGMIHPGADDTSAVRATFMTVLYPPYRPGPCKRPRPFLLITTLR